MKNNIGKTYAYEASELDAESTTDQGRAPVAGGGADYRTGTVVARSLGRTVPYGLLAGCLYLMFSGRLISEGIGTAAIVMMLVLLFLKIPVAIALILPGVLGLWAVQGWPAAEGVMTDLPFESVAQWSLSVLPMFILMGLLLGQSGLTSGLYLAGRQWLNWLPGGLAIGTNVAGTGMAAVSGSTMGTTYALGRIGIPEMLNAGYDRRLAVATVLTAGLPGQLIPPSVMLVVFAGIAQAPVGPLLLAGVGPGALVAVMCSLMILMISAARPTVAGRGGRTRERVRWSTKVGSLRSLWPLPLLVAVVIGGMISGFFTPTEAGAAGAAGALLATLWSRRSSRPFSAIGEALTATVQSAGAIFILILGSYVLADLLAVTGIGDAFTDWVAGTGLSRIEFLLVILVSYLVLGMFMDPLSMMLLTVPLLIPTLNALDISLLWFGVFAVFMGELAIITPPVGVLIYIVHAMTKEPSVNVGHSISLKDCFVALGWFMPVCIAIAVILIFVPSLATFLPQALSS